MKTEWIIIDSEKSEVRCERCKGTKSLSHIIGKPIDFFTRESYAFIHQHKSCASVAITYIHKEVIGDCTLYLGDCVNIIPTLGMVDHIITDPPYGEKTHKGARSLHRDGTLDVGFIDFSAIALPELLLLIGSLLAITNRWIIFTCEWRYAAAIEERFTAEFIRLGVWVKPNGAPQYTGDRPSTGWEAVVMMHNKGRKKWNGGGHHAVWIENIVRPGDNKHPTEKPIALIADFVKKFTDPGDTVLDPFMGGGTTAAACAKMGPKFIGIEIDPKYFDISVQRLRELNSNTDLFLGPVKQKQMPLGNLCK